MHDYPIRRAYASASPWTWSIPPVHELVRRHWPFEDRAITIDPFAGRSQLASHRNDIDPRATAASCEDAETWLVRLVGSGIVADAVLLDPPYSPRQVAEHYRAVGRGVTRRDTQIAGLYRRCKDLLDKLLRPGGLAITAGWNSSGFGTTRGYLKREMLLVCHGGAHNDTIVVVETKPE